MNFSTNLKLFVKGYSFEDIKALSEIEGINDGLALECADKELKVDDIKAIAEMSKATGVTPEGGENSGNGTDEPSKNVDNNIDYKALYEAEKLKVENLQKMNVNSPVGDDTKPKTDFEKLCELMEKSKD